MCLAKKSHREYRAHLQATVPHLCKAHQARLEGMARPGRMNMESTHINEIAATLDDLSTTLDEIIERSQAMTVAIKRMRQSLEKATDEIDQLDAENRQGDPAGSWSDRLEPPDDYGMLTTRRDAVARRPPVPITVAVTSYSLWPVLRREAFPSSKRTRRDERRRFAHHHLRSL